MGSGPSKYGLADDDAGLVVVIACAGVGLLTSVVYDIATVGRSVDKYNHSHTISDLRLKPTYFANHKAPGVMLTLSF